MTATGHDLVPDEFLEAYDAETVPEALEAAERSDSTTPRDEMKRCPIADCRSVRIILKPGMGGECSHRIDTRYKCSNCGTHFDQPAPPRAEADAAGDSA